MTATRREFVERVSLTAAATAFFPNQSVLPRDLALFAEQQGMTWDTSWTKKLQGAHKACFDCTEPESGFGVWRASAWAGQYAEVLKAAPAQLSPVIILRHNAIILAMQQSFWDKYQIGKSKSVTHPLTQQPLDKNPALLDDKDGLPAPFNVAGLHKQIARGVVALACNLALQQCVELVKSKDGVSDEEARKRAVAALVPGVILQPSGVFAAVLAQESGCAYVKAS